MKAPIVLVVAVAISSLILFYGPPVAEAGLLALGDGVASDPALADTLFALAIYGALLAPAVAGALLSGVNPLRPGARPLAMAGLGIATGLAGLAAATFYVWLAGALAPVASPSADVTLLLWGTAATFLQAGSEEVYFRGWLQPVLAQRWGKAAAVGVAALAFALLHFLGGASGGVALVNLLLGGLLFGWLAARTGGVAAPALAHFAWNWTEDIGLGLVPNPGTGSYGAIRDFDLVGPAIWGGSEQGLNASVAMSLALLALLVPLLLVRSGRLSGEPGRAAAVDPVALGAESV
jgi:membrane protease YdiL (CAAX protease family)